MNILIILLVVILAAAVIGAAVYLIYESRKHAQKLAIDPETRIYEPGDMVITTIVPRTSDRARLVIERLSLGEELMLLREKDHPEDPNAIQVIYSGHETNLNDTVIGYLPSALAAKLAPIFDEHALGTHRYVFCHVSGIGRPSLHGGVQIRFKLPSAEDLKLQRDKRSIEKFL